MSSSVIRDCSNSSSTSTSNNTVIIIVQNADQNVTLDGDLQEMIGAGSDVSVLQMNNGAPFANALPQTEDGSIDASLLLNDSFASNFSIDGLAPDIAVAGVPEDQCTDFPLDADGIRKIESAINSEEAKDILGETLVNFVNSPSALIDELHSNSPEISDVEGKTPKRKQKSPKRRSQRQLDKAEKEEVEKILAENKKMMQQEKEMMRLAEEEKQKEMEVVQETDDDESEDGEKDDESDESEEDDDDKVEEQDQHQKMKKKSKKPPQKKVLKISPNFTNKAKRLSHPGKQGRQPNASAPKSKNSLATRKVVTQELSVKLTKLPAKNLKKTTQASTLLANQHKSSSLKRKKELKVPVKKEKTKSFSKKNELKSLKKKLKNKEASSHDPTDSETSDESLPLSHYISSNSPKKISSKDGIVTPDHHDEEGSKTSSSSLELGSSSDSPKKEANISSVVDQNSFTKCDEEKATSPKKSSQSSGSMKVVSRTMKPAPLSKKLKALDVLKKRLLSESKLARSPPLSQIQNANALSKKQKLKKLSKKSKDGTPSMKMKTSPFIKKLNSGSLFKKKNSSLLQNRGESNVLTKRKKLKTLTSPPKKKLSSSPIQTEISKKENFSPDFEGFKSMSKSASNTNEKTRDGDVSERLLQDTQSPENNLAVHKHKHIEESPSSKSHLKRKASIEASEPSPKKPKQSISSTMDDNLERAHKKTRESIESHSNLQKKLNSMKSPKISSALSKFKIPHKKILSDDETRDSRTSVTGLDGVHSVLQPMNQGVDRKVMPDASNLVAKNVSQTDLSSTLEDKKEKSSHIHSTSPHLFQKQIKKRPSFEALLSMSDNFQRSNQVTFKAKSSVAPKVKKFPINSQVESEMAQVRKSNRAIKKKVLDDEFVCPDESIAYSDEEESDHEIEVEDADSSVHLSDSDGFDEYDDPSKLWCKCQKPHNHRFMICCDGCQNWFHGSCVGVTKAMGKTMEQNNEEWVCSDCKEEIKAGRTPLKKRERKKPKPKPSNKSTLKKWDETPENLSRDPSEARVLVYHKKTMSVLSGAQAPTLAILQEWLDSHPNYSPVLPSMTARIITDPETGAKRLDLPSEKSGNARSSPNSYKQKKVSPLMTAKRFYPSKESKDNTSPYQPPKKIKLLDVDDFQKPPKKKKAEKLEKLDIAKAKKQSSDKIKSPQTPKAVTPTEKVPNKAKVRDAVKKMLFDALDKRRMDVKSEFPEINSNKVQTLCSTIEDEIYRYFSKDVGFKYKSRNRSLVFNIKDSKNEGLFRKILNGDIKPYNLAKMTPEELASKELAAWRQQAEKKELEAIQKFELERLALGDKFIMKSHKGEIAIDKEEFSASKTIEPVVLKLPEDTDADATTTTTTTSECKRKRRCSHSYDPTCEDCLKWSLETNQEILSKMNSEIEKRDKHRSHHKSHKSRRSSSDKRHRSRDERHSSSKHSSKRRHSSSKHRDRSSSREGKEGKETEKSNRSSENAPDKVSSSSLERKSDVTNAPESQAPPLIPQVTDVDRDLISEILPDSPRTPPLPEIPYREDTPPLPEIPYRSATPPLPDSPGTPDIEESLLSPSTPPRKEQKTKGSPPIPLWRGNIHMPDVTKFHTACFEVSGDTEFLSTDIPSSVDIVGRINPDHVWTYVSQIRKSGTKDIVVVRFQPSSEDEKVSYIALYSYLSSKKRYGVVGKCPGSIKDFYIVPLASHQAIPQVLLPFDGPGFEDNRPHMLVAIIIKSKTKSFMPPIKDVIKPKVNPSIPDELEEYSPPDEISDSPIMIDDPDLPQPSKEQEDLLKELNRQIESDRAEINEMQSNLNKEMEDTKTSQPEISQVVLPSNLQDILDNINKKEKSIKEKEIEIQKRLNSEPETVIDTSKDVDLRVLMPPQQPMRGGEMRVNQEFPVQPPNYNYYPPVPQAEPSYPVQPSAKSQLNSMSDNDLLQKAREMEEAQFSPEPYIPVDPPNQYNNHGSYEPPSDYGFSGPPQRGGHQPFRGHPGTFEGHGNPNDQFFRRDRQGPRGPRPYNNSRRDYPDRNWGNRGGFRARPRFDDRRQRHNDNRDNRDRRRYN